MRCINLSDCIKPDQACAYSASHSTFQFLHLQNIFACKSVISIAFCMNYFGIVPVVDASYLYLNVNTECTVMFLRQ